MKNILSTMLSSFKSKITPLWSKVRLWTSLSFWRTQGISKVRQFFVKVFDIKPRHKKDYYSVFRWLVSKRLAYALVIALGLGSLYLIASMSPSFFSASDGNSAIRTYKYNSVPLKFYKGTVRILAKDRHVAYIGNVDGGAATGNGSLYDSDGALMYEGQFGNSMYNGKGKLYYKTGPLRYSGDFVNNVFQGTGSYYRESGSLEYVGDYDSGYRNGQGVLYNSGGNIIFTGSFQMDQLLYSEFVGKKVTDSAKMYTGTTSVYSTDSEYCVSMDEINAVYTVQSGEKSLESEWAINGVTVLGNQFPVEGKTLSTVNELTEYFGAPNYYGSSYVTLSEAVSMNLLGEKSDLGIVTMQTTNTLDGVYDVSSYDKNCEVYIYTYLKDDLSYTFYCSGSASPTFSMYTIESTK